MVTALSFRRMDGGCKSFVGFRSPLVARARAGEGVSDARCPPGGGATACVGDSGETNSAEGNIARRQPVTPAPVAWGFCRGSRFAQKCCLRFAFTFAFDLDMESGNGRVPEPWCRVTDHLSVCAGHRSACW